MVKHAPAFVAALLALTAACGGDDRSSGGPPAPSAQPTATAGEPTPTPAIPTPAPTPTGTSSPVPPVALLATEPAAMRSEDGGRTWQVALPLADARVTLADANVGWAHARGDVFTTRDGGRTWESRGETLGLSYVGSIAFIDPQRGALHGGVTGAGDASSAALLHTVDGGATWPPALLDGATQRRLDVSRIDRICLDPSGVGFAAGLASLSASATEPTVLVTSDAGASWRDASDRVEPSFASGVFALACPGDGSFWLLTFTGDLLHSADTGESWQLATLPPFATPNASAVGVGFADPDRGWLAALDGVDLVLFRTLDGGRTWREQLRREQKATQGVAFDFADAEHGLAGIVAPRGYPPFPFAPTPVPATLLATADGGASWLEVDLQDRWSPNILGAVSDVAIRGVAYAPEPLPTPDPDTGLPSALLGARELGVARSSDGGASWQESFSLRSSPGSGSPAAPLLRAVLLADRDRGYAAGEGGIILRTDDGGRSWSSQAQNVALPNARNVSYEELAFFDAQRGVVGGGVDPDVTNFTRSPVLLHTTDGGASWIPATIIDLDSPPAGDSRVPRHICFTRTGRGVAADTVSGTFSSGGTVTTGFEGKLVLVTGDAGASWTSIERGMDLPEDFRLWGVACAGDAELWLVGGRQRLPSELATPYALESVDGGATWDEVVVSLPDWLTVGRSVSSATFLTSALGWFAAPPLSDALVLLRTLDGGASWQTALTADGTAFDNARVVFADERHGLVVASRVFGPLHRQPAVFFTRDGGATWSVTDFPRSSTSRAFLDVAVAR